MSTPILATKLYIPPARPNLVVRPRLIEQLNAGLGQGQGFGRKLTLISAPAGFGKTTLVSEWIASGTGPVAWLSLDEGDNDPTRFLIYLVAALQTLVPKIGDSVFALLQSPQPPPIATILTALINEISLIPERFILVLDDYHVLDAKPIDDALTFLLEHMPPQMHLVITTREDPLLPLARYRVRGQLTEVRAADLRFTPAEAAGFLNQVMGLTLSVQEIAALESRTEGWVAGLQMAALSMQGRADSASFIQAFTGSHRFVLDYLAEEVLQRQPERVRSFLLQTSILERLCAPLCNAVTDQEDGRGMLDALERGNLFVIPLDDQRQWYRYHHLFADVLQARLTLDQPTQVAILHQRASDWYEQNEQRADAIRHAFAAQDFERAANLVELTWPAIHRSDFRSAMLLGWLERLPDELIRVRPVLSVGYAWELLNGGEFEAADSWLRDAERWLNTDTDTGVDTDADTVTTMCEHPASLSEAMVVADEAEFRELPAEIASARAYYALALGDVSGTVTYARQALDLIPKTDHIRRGPAASLLGLAHWTSGDLAEAHRALAEGMASFQTAGNIAFALSGTFGLADILIAQGQLRAAAKTYTQSLQIALSHAATHTDSATEDEPVIQGTADLYQGLSEVYHEQGNREAATQHLLRSEELGEKSALATWPRRLCFTKARIKEAEGDLDGTLDLLDEAERLYVRSPVPDVRSVAAWKTRIWLKQGRLTDALDWVRAQGLSIDDNLSYLQEDEHITLARVLIAQYKHERINAPMQAAMVLLTRLLHAAKAKGRTGSVIEILVLQALAHEAQGDMPSAFVALERALTLAEPEGYIRIFVDEGPTLAALLHEMAKHAAMPQAPIANYVNQLLAAFDHTERKRADNPALPPVSSLPPPSTQPLIESLIEPLSQRELEVLQLIAQGLSNREISERLFLSVNTVKGHNRIIFGKLQVQRRTEAVARAQALGLV